jgi:hypothetical protein
MASDEIIISETVPGFGWKFEDRDTPESARIGVGDIEHPPPGAGRYLIDEPAGGFL